VYTIQDTRQEHQRLLMWMGAENPHTETRRRKGHRGKAKNRDKAGNHEGCPYRRITGAGFDDFADAGRLKAKIKNKTNNPLFPKFPAYGVFLLKRPKGTKSRRWARGLPNA